MPKTRAELKIRQNAAGHLEDTAPERTWDRFAEERGYYSTKPEPREFVVIDDEGKRWRLKPDRVLWFWNVVVHLDGPYHWSEKIRRRDDWEDRLLTTQYPLRSFRIDTPLIEVKRYWDYVDAELDTFIRGDSKTKRLWR